VRFRSRLQRQLPNNKKSGITMSRIYSLAYLTAAPLSPPEAISMAAELGYHHVGVRLLPAMAGGDFSPLIENPALLRETMARVADTGVSVFDVEIVRLTPEFRIETVRPFLAACGALSARAVLVVGDDPDAARLIANYAAFAAAAAPYGLTADLEFLPWASVSSCAIARRVVEQAGAPNGRILVDALHVARSATSIADLQALPCSMLSYAQICDAEAAIPTTVEGLIHTARVARLLPGEGGIPLTDIFAALPPDLPVSIEIPHLARLADLGPREWSRQAIEASRRVLEG
jgi:sugar phosphate isomerase/epimerase